MNASKITTVTAEATPNPNTYKFNVNRILKESGSVDFPNAAAAKGSALGEAIFKIRHVESVMVGKDFVTVTKVPCAGWETLAGPIRTAILSVLNDEKLFFEVESEPRPKGKNSSGSKNETIRKICEVLDNEIRPALAMDGGDVAFVDYEGGIVKLHLQGSCRHCPSAVMTLRMGVEARLKSLIPEIREVVPV